MGETHLKQRLDRLEVIWAMGLAIDRVQARRGGLDELLITVHEGISKLMDAENFLVALCDQERRNFRFAYYRDTVDPVDPTAAGWIPLAEGDSMLTSWVIKNAQPLVIDALGPGWTPAAVVRRITTTADDLGTRGFDTRYGSGLVDAQEAATGVRSTP